MTTLITGASSGIGLELARICAAHKHDLVLVARSGDKLRALADELKRSGVRIDVFQTDLSHREAPAAVQQFVELKGLTVDILVNNAGYGLYGRFTETSLATELDMIQLNVVALTELTKRMLPGMVARKQGRILNLASTASFLPGPLMAVYYATKAYVLSFSEAIATELDGTGVTVTALCPGPTASGFQSTAHLEDSKLVAGRTLPTAAAVARFGYDALMAGTAVAIPGATNKLTANIHRFFPRAMVRKTVMSAQERRT
ncbi:MAG TPA: SDR family oxidoreductase [Vicinamibacterales bacterium]